MENDKNLEKQEEALKEEEMDGAAGGMRTSGSLDPHCPRCESKMFIVAINGAPSNLACCLKCGYECKLTAALLG